MGRVSSVFVPGDAVTAVRWHRTLDGWVCTQISGLYICRVKDRAKAWRVNVGGQAVTFEAADWLLSLD